MGEVMYSSTDLYIRNQIEESGQLHAPITLHPEIELQVLTYWVVLWVSDSVPTYIGEEKNPATTRKRTKVFQPVAIHYITEICQFVSNYYCD
jgi:hypothetical protein